LAIEVKNSAKVTLLSFIRTAVFLYDVMVSENAVLEARWCRVSSKTPFFNSTRNICRHRRSHFNEKSLQKVLPSFWWIWSMNL